MTELYSLPQRIVTALQKHGAKSTRELRSMLEVSPKNLGPALSRLVKRGFVAYSGPPPGAQRGGRYGLTREGLELAGRPASELAVAFKPGTKSMPSRIAPSSGVIVEAPRPRFAIDDGTNVAINSGTNSVVLAKGDALRLHQFLEQMSPLLEQEDDEA